MDKKLIPFKDLVIERGRGEKERRGGERERERDTIENVWREF